MPHQFHAPTLPDDMGVTYTPPPAKRTAPSFAELESRLALANRLVYSLRSIVVLNSYGPGTLVWESIQRDLARWERGQQ